MRHADPEAGYVTLGALCIAALLAAFMLGSMSSPRPTLARAVLGLEDASVNALLESGLAVSMHALLEDQADRSLVLQRDARLLQGAVRIAMRPEASLVDINVAGADLLSALYEASGGSSMSARGFAEAVMRLRDATAADPPFPGPGHLHLIEGLSDDDIARLSRYVTTYSALSAIDPWGADPELMRALPGVSILEVDRMTRRRDENAGASDQSMQNLFAAHGRFFLAEPATRYRVKLSAVSRSGRRSSAQAIVDTLEEPPWVELVAWVREPTVAPPGKEP